MYGVCGMVYVCGVYGVYVCGVYVWCVWYVYVFHVCGVCVMCDVFKVRGQLWELTFLLLPC